MVYALILSIEQKGLCKANAKYRKNSMIGLYSIRLELSAEEDTI